MKTRMRPVGNPLDVAMLDRVVMDVIDMSGEIILIADRMFPIPSLPDAPFALELPAFREAFALGYAR